MAEAARTLGTGPTVGALGLGCRPMGDGYGPLDDRTSVAVVRQALDLGVTLLQTGGWYGDGADERLVGRALRGRRDQAVVATTWRATTPEQLRDACAASLQHLGVDAIDLATLDVHWLDRAGTNLRALDPSNLDLPPLDRAGTDPPALGPVNPDLPPLDRAGTDPRTREHRRAPVAPVEELVGARADLVQAGDVRALGLRDPSADELRRAHAVHPIAAIGVEYSLWAREVETDLLPMARGLGVGVVAGRPLGRGFLTGTITDADLLDAGDVRRRDPRFHDGNLGYNLALVRAVRGVADRLDATPGQVALAWLLHQGADIVPVPGTKRPGYLGENVAAATIELDATALTFLDEAVPPGAAAGARPQRGRRPAPPPAAAHPS